ncbi:MAG: TonB-dependent receptor, partial [Parahaliea sp.]
MNKPSPARAGLAVLAALPLYALAQAPVLEEVVVRGTKIEKSLQDTADSVALFSATTLEQRGLINLEDVINQTAGVVMGSATSGSGSDSSFRIRGIDSGPIGTLRSELASFYVDGVALSGWVKAEGPQQMWDVSQVEILRGPQSTNLGRNSLAGAIYVTTQRPLYENSGSLRVGVGNDNTTQFSGTANISLKDGVSALRLSADQYNSDGAVTNVTLDDDDIAFVERTSLRAKWLYEPGDDLSILASLEYVDNGYGDATQTFEGSGYRSGDRKALANVRGEYLTEAWLGSLTVDYRLSEQWSLRSITAGMDGDRSRRDDFDDSALDGGVVLRDAQDRTISQELRFNYQGDRLQGSTGIYYSQIDADNVNDTTAAVRAADFGLGPLVALGIYPEIFRFMTGGTTSLETTNAAVFTEWEWRFAPRWRLSLGARYDWEKQEVSFQSTGSTDEVLPNPSDWAAFGLEETIYGVNAMLSALTADGLRHTPDTDFDAFLPHIGLTYDWTDNVSTSFFVKRGYRAGGTEITSLNRVNSYDPEYLTNYELALRSVLLDGRATFNANIYYADWDDQQVVVPELADNTTFTRIDNAGASKIYGVEAAFNLRASERLSLYATAGYSYTEYTDFVSATSQDLSGNHFTFAPEETAALGFDYRLDQGFCVNANVTYTGDAYTDQENDIDLDEYTLVNLRGGYRTEAWQVEAYVTNLADEDYAVNRFGLQDARGNDPWGRMG